LVGATSVLLTILNDHDLLLN